MFNAMSCNKMTKQSRRLVCTPQQGNKWCRGAWTSVVSPEALPHPASPHPQSSFLTPVSASTLTLTSLELSPCLFIPRETLILLSCHPFLMTKATVYSSKGLSSCTFLTPFSWAFSLHKVLLILVIFSSLLFWETSSVVFSFFHIIGIIIVLSWDLNSIMNACGFILQFHLQQSSQHFLSPKTQTCSNLSGFLPVRLIANNLPVLVRPFWAPRRKSVLIVVVFCRSDR